MTAVFKFVKLHIWYEVLKKSREEKDVKITVKEREIGEVKEDDK
jgi:hypothetical protein